MRRVIIPGSQFSVRSSPTRQTWTKRAAYAHLPNAFQTKFILKHLSESIIFDIILLSIARKKTGRGTGKEKKRGDKKVRKIIAPNECDGGISSFFSFFYANRKGKQKTIAHTHIKHSDTVKKFYLCPPSALCFAPDYSQTRKLNCCSFFNIP